MTLYNFAVSYGEPRHSLRSAYGCKKFVFFGESNRVGATTASGWGRPGPDAHKGRCSLEAPPQALGSVAFRRVQEPAARLLWLAYTSQSLSTSPPASVGSPAPSRLRARRRIQTEEGRRRSAR